LVKMKISQSDFQAEPWQETIHDGKPVWIRICRELRNGRWQEFISVTDKHPNRDGWDDGTVVPKPPSAASSPKP
jgi:hypothetical protein